MNASCQIWMSHVYEWVMSLMNQSCHLWMRHVTYEVKHVTYRGVSHMNASCHNFIFDFQLFFETWRALLHIYHRSWKTYQWISHVTFERVMSHLNESCHIWMSHVTFEWVMSHLNVSCHIWMSHVTFECVVSQFFLPSSDLAPHVVSLKTFTYEWATSHLDASCQKKKKCTGPGEPCSTYRRSWDSHLWMSHVTFEWVMSQKNFFLF